MRGILLVLLFVKCIFFHAFQLIAQNNNEEVLETGYQFYENSDYISAINVFERIIKKDPLNLNANIYLGYSWMGRYRYDSALYFLNKAILLDSTNAELFFARGFSYCGYDLSYNGHACINFRWAKELGYKDPWMDSFLLEKCWKYDQVRLPKMGIEDSTLLDRIYSVLPEGWNIYQLKDHLYLRDSYHEIDKKIIYEIILTNDNLAFLDSLWSPTDKISPEISMLVVNKRSIESTNNIVQAKNSYPGFDAKQYSISIEGKKQQLIFYSGTEFYMNRSLKEWEMEHYFRDKHEIIQILGDFAW